MCVLNRRADVAKICLGRMGLFRGARALRAVDQDNSDTKIAILAIHLNMKVCLIQSCQARINFDLTAALIEAKVVPRVGKQEFRRTDFGSRLLAAGGEGGSCEGEGGEDRCG